MLQQLIFGLLTIAVFGLAGRQFWRIRKVIHLGKPEKVAGDRTQRWRNMLLVAFGQQKMFSNWLPAILHLFIYVAFLITQIELIEILVDGFGGVHRFFAPILGGVYTFVISTIELLSLLAFVSTLIFLSRRNLLRIPRFSKTEMQGWPTLDANLILFAEILLIIGIFSMNGADVLLQKLDPAHYPDTGNLLISSLTGPLVFGSLDQGSLAMVERSGWWLHILVVFGFLVYLPYSKHLHILLAFPNTWYASLRPRGEMENMPEIMGEVKSMMGLGDENGAEELPENFGAHDVFELSRLNLLNAYSCTECGRCTAVCPANLTGKKLSPRKIMMDIRDRAEEVARTIEMSQGGITAGKYDDGKSLFDYISREEIHACTTCNACVEACPIMINPLDPILKLRRYEILSESAGPGDWLPMFNSIENSGSAWSISDPRDQWTRES